ncbi:MAG: S-methyl-5-thioribose-1-phosphate isomerase [Planctomycetota bacterium]|nr:MAG: S-methyl-5-thioribose-1-phosphate isomerase [Planctomycetota bacterium]
MPVKPIKWVGNAADGHIWIIDQTRLPLEHVELELRETSEMYDAIKRLAVRGAPLLGVSAGYGVMLGIQKAKDTPELMNALEKTADYLAGSRPTAVNLFWGLKRMRAAARENSELPADELRNRLLEEAIKIQEEDIQLSREMGKNGVQFINDGDAVMTHCNAGALATGGYGTALGVFFAAKEAGKDFSVYSCETRPLLQGARLTTWELMQEGIPVTLITDSMAAALMKAGKINAVMTGADRVAANGDAANKIGTYSHAINARVHDVPFFIVAPLSTIDLATPSGDQIPIEERDPSEVAGFRDVRVAPEGVDVYNPAFDVTPAQLIQALITDAGVAEPPNLETVAALFG